MTSPNNPTNPPATDPRARHSADTFDGYNHAHNGGQYDDEIDLRELFAVIWQGKWIIMAVTFLFAVGSVIYALSLSNTYRSSVLLAPASESGAGGMSALAGQFGGLASLAGISLGGGGDNKVDLAIEIIKSRQFAFALMEAEDMVLPLMAAEGWDKQKDALVFDEKIYDLAKKKWVRKPTSYRNSEPSLQEAYIKYGETISVSRDKKSGLVNVSATFYSPTLAKQWVEAVVESINTTMKQKDMFEAKKSIEYLKKQIGQTAIADMQKVFYQLIEEQSKTIMLAEVRDEYVFTTIDPAVVPERKHQPKRALICVLGTLLGGMLSVFGVLVFAFFRKKPDERSQA